MEITTKTRYTLNDDDAIFISCYDNLGLDNLSIQRKEFAIEMSLRKAESFIRAFATKVKSMRIRVDKRKEDEI